MSAWKEGRYNTSSRQAGFLTLVVMWRSRDSQGESGYEARMEPARTGAAIVGRYATKEEAQKAAEDFAVRELRAALEAIESQGGTT